MRLGDLDALYGIESLLNTDIVQKSQEAAWLMSQVLHDIQASPTIDPETLPIVRQLREELARVKAERDAALRELRSIQTHTRSLRDYVDDEIHPVVDYSIYLNLREAVDTIDSWQHITPDGAIKEAHP